MVASAPVTAPQASAENAGSVTITGCLETDGERFRLVETAGSDVPRSRSWRTGFLGKRPAPVAVIDAANRTALMVHVGQRVAVTGTLTRRELEARSLRPVASSCDV